MNRYLDIYLNSYRGLSKPAWMLALVMLLNRSGAMVLPFLGIYMNEHLGFTLKQSGLVLSCFGIGAMIGAWLGGWLTDKIGHYKIQVISLFLSAPLFCLLPLFDTVKSLGLAMMVLSVAYEIFRPANSVAITYHAKPENITRAFSLNRMAVNLGFSVGPALAGFLSEISYDLLFYGNGIALIIAGITFVIYFGKLEKKKKKKKKAENKEIIKEIKILPKERSPYKDLWFMVFSVLCAFYAIAFFQLLNTLPLFYKNEIGMSKFEVGMILAYSGLIVCSLEMLLVYIAERRMTISKTIVLGIVLCGVAYSILLLKSGVWILYVSITFLCLSEIFAIPFMSVVAAKRSGKANKGAYMGLNALSFSVALIFAPYLGTEIAERFGFDVLWISLTVLTFFTAIGVHFVMKKMFANTIIAK